MQINEFSKNLNLCFASRALPKKGTLKVTFRLYFLKGKTKTKKAKLLDGERVGSHHVNHHQIA